MFVVSCASLIDGTTRTVNLTTTNPDYDRPIKVQIANKNTIQNIYVPGTTVVKASNSSLNITVKDKCFRQTTITSSSRLNYWTLGNLITGGVFGTTTDALTGALWTYDEGILIPVEENGTCKASNVEISNVEK